MTVTEMTNDTGPVYDAEGLGRPAWAMTSPLLRHYYDTEWGMPVHEESALLERLCLEGFQAGLNWELVLRKRDAFREAFAGFDADLLSSFGEEEIERLMENDGIIRNRISLHLDEVFYLSWRAHSHRLLLVRNPLQQLGHVEVRGGLGFGVLLIPCFPILRPRG